MTNKNKMATSIPFSLLFLSLLSLHTSGHSTSQNLIDETCRACSQEDPNVNFDFCTTSLKSAQIDQPLTLFKLGKISVKLLKYNVTDTRARAKELFNKEIDTNMKKRFDDCFKLYDNAMPNIKQAVEFYVMKQFYEVNYKVTSAMDAASACGDGFREIGREVPEMEKRDSDTFELGAMVLSIMHMLQFGY